MGGNPGDDRGSRVLEAGKEAFANTTLTPRCPGARPAARCGLGWQSAGRRGRFAVMLLSGVRPRIFKSRVTTRPAREKGGCYRTAGRPQARANFWAAELLQSQICRRVPLPVAPFGESAHRPLAGLDSEPSPLATQFWKPPLLQVANWS